MILTKDKTKDIYSHLSKKNINIILIGEKSDLDITDLIQKANQSEIIIGGAIFPMIVHHDKTYDDAIIIKHIDSIYNPLLIKNIDKVNIERQLPDLAKDTKSCLIFADGLSSGIPNLLEKLYEKYWNNINYIGAGAGSLSLMPTPCVFTNNGFEQDAAMVLFINQNIEIGVKHGWKKVSGPYVANRTSAGKIIELNWRPAFHVYREVVEKHSEKDFDRDDFFNISQGFPFGIYRENREDIVRDPISVDQYDTLHCVGIVDQHTSLNILKGDKASLFKAAKEATTDSLSSKKENLKEVLLVDCISRILYLQDEFKSELRTVKKTLSESGCKLPLEGVLSIGEIASDKEGYLEFYNKTIVVSTFQ